MYMNSTDRDRGTCRLNTGTVCTEDDLLGRTQLVLCRLASVYTIISGGNWVRVIQQCHNGIIRVISNNISYIAHDYVQCT